jgi:AraC family transcriptional regulator of adaptative response/methylated-DNA-[protein]-cysteine methyltransferase
VRELCRYIEKHSDEPLPLTTLAKKAGLSPFHLQRSFKATVGLTPRQYLEAARLRKLKGHLRSSADVTGAVYEAGYGSSSRVYERADTRLGMTPNQYRQGGRNVTITHVTIDSPLGLMMIGATDRGLCFIHFGDSARDMLASLKKEYPAARLEPMGKPYHPDFQKWIGALSRHLEGKQPHLDLPLDIRATSFQMRVWNYLQSIPYGEVQSYSEVAAGIGQPRAARAVARACASNELAVVIPCHRVIRGTGELGGYRWGLPRKRALIDRERSAKASAG